MASKKQEGATREIELSKLEVNRGQLYGLPKNPRFIRDERFEALKKSIRDDPEMLSLRELIVYPLENGNFLVIGGNMRLRACEELGYDALPCKVLPVETPVAKLRAYVVKDNVAFGENDWDAFANEWDLDELKAMGLELDGIEDGQEEKPEVTEDDFNEDEAEPRCKRGEIWQLGAHRLMCGDSTDAADVAKLMGGKRADIAFTSPPYNMKFDCDGKAEKRYAQDGAYKYYDDNLSDDDYFSLLNCALENLLSCCDDVFLNIGFVSGALASTAKLIGNHCKEFCGAVIWKKNKGFVPAFPVQHGILSNICEPIYIFNKNGLRKLSHPQWSMSEGSFNIVETENASKNEFAEIHKAVFPLSLAFEMVSRFSEEKVVDLFGGTGTTLIACEQLGRKCFMMELSAKYCDLIISRWEQLTGKTAEKVA